MSDAERELYGGRLRYDQSYVRHEGPLTRMKFGRMAAALPHMVGMVLRTGWKADRRALLGVVSAELGQGATAAWGAGRGQRRPGAVVRRRSHRGQAPRRAAVPGRARGRGGGDHSALGVVATAATMHADHIHVLDQGCVVEDGTHEDLMARTGGLYQGMFTAQAAQAAQYGQAPVPDPVPRPRGTQPSGHETVS
ncbi:hypothetical protein AW27_000240 [Streptomyces sp. PCS3-D2]|uniref:hypothetical protein n=1 Tax=Streptomyces sp. PCS3-D2 TaxID=1460244 RepID=UPI00191C24C2|nr:hypothetical protein [Streptomyces sp. PCS3-D2]WKV70075.1 hypothetical protein AW27_000240 [Streptomyces sp. PCS3-D2]